VPVVDVAALGAALPHAPIMSPGQPGKGAH
jgi:hypothetical protein